MSPISILLMMIVDTVAQVAQQGRWRPTFEVNTAVHLYFRPSNFDYNRPTGIWPLAEARYAHIVPADKDAEEEAIEHLQAMLDFARRHLNTSPEA